MRTVLALFAVAFLAGIARHLYKVATGRKPSTLEWLRDDADRHTLTEWTDDGHTTFVISVSPRVRDQL